MYQQFNALFGKNLLLAWRNKRATFLQLFASFIFLFLVFCIEKATDGPYVVSAAFKDPATVVSPPIPPCEDKFYTKLPCFDFLWSGNSSDRVSRIVESIRRNNPGRPIPRSKVRCEVPSFCISVIFGLTERLQILLPCLASKSPDFASFILLLTYTERCS